MAAANLNHMLTELLPVMIVSYETLRTLSVYLANCSIGLLLCDEGHRLKNSGKSIPLPEIHFIRLIP